MKTKKTLLYVLLNLCFITANSQIKPYTIRQVKDTISKYNNIIKAYEQLDKGCVAEDGYTLIYEFPSYDSIRNDMELKKELLGLLDIKKSEHYQFKKFQKEFKGRFIKKELDSLKYIKKFLRNSVYPKLELEQ